MREACLWLKDKDNQTDALRTLWFLLLDTQCRTFLEVVKAVPIALHALHKQDLTPYTKRNSAGLLTVGLETTQRMQLEFLKAIVPVLQDRGTFWYIGTNGAFYCTDYCTDYHDKPNPGFRGLGSGGQQRMALAISKADQGKANPRLHLFSLGGGRIYHARLTWPSGGLEEFKDLPIEEGADCSDIWATYGASNPEDPDKIYFYTAHGGKEVRGYILGYNNDKQESKIAWRHPVDNVTWVRVVHYPKSLTDDPDENPENPRVLSGIDWIVYGGCRGKSQIFVLTSDPAKKGYILAQDEQMWGSNTYQRIAVDQQYLWIANSPGWGLYITTHTSVVKALANSAQPSRPSWFTGPDSTELSPCDDGTLFRTGGTRVSYKPYTLTKEGLKAIILRDNWTDLPDQAIQVQKLPNYDWLLVGGLITTLENRVQAAMKMKMAGGS
jgi:hypothetical protein